MATGHPTILIPIVRGHMARLLIYSGVINKLIEMGAKIILLTYKNNVENLSACFADSSVEVEIVPPSRLRLYYRWNRLYTYYFETFLPTESSAAKLEWLKQHDPQRYRRITALSPIMLQRLRSFWLHIRRIVMPSRLYKSIFLKHPIDLVVVGSAARNPEEYYMLRYALTHGIRNICTLQSWDLLTTKGDLLERPEHLTVWNDANHQEAVALFNYPPEDVLVVGAPQFDIYFDPNTYLTHQDWCEQYGFDPNKKVILVTGGSGNIHHNLPNVIKALIEGMASNEIEEIQILVRPHPAVYLGTVSGDGTEADLCLYESWHPSVKGNRPQASQLKIVADTAAIEHIVLANNLYHADVLVDFYGTVSVEACLVDTPVIYADVRASFVDGETEPKSVIDRNEYTHLKRVIQTGGVRIVGTRQQLYAAIKNYLNNPSLDSEGRREIAASFGYTNKGYSVARMAQAIYDYGRGIWPPCEPTS